jgi:RNA polymerase sigma-70 factor (ECF subfamily)
VDKGAQQEDDRLLVERCQKGDELAFEELVRKYQQSVFNLIHHNLGYAGDVEDVAQKIFIKIYFSLPKFDNKRPFFPWLYRIAVNQCYDELRRIRRHRVHTFTELSLEDNSCIEKLINQNDPSPPPTSGEQKELQSLLLKLLDQLPAQQRMAIVLRDLEDIPYDKLSKIMNCSEQAARLKVFRGRNCLRKLVEKAQRRQKRSS